MQKKSDKKEGASSLKFGIRFNSDSGSIVEILKLSKIAEQNGFEFVWYCEDLFKRDAWIVLTAIASVTKQIKLGTALVNPYSSNPAELAMRIATLQEYSGRAILGIGPGDLSSLKWVGNAPKYPFTGTKEAISIIRTLLYQKHAYDNKRVVFRNWTKQTYLRFKINQKIPIYIGGQRPKMLELMGELGDGALPLLFPPSCASSVVDRITKGVKRVNRQITDIDIAGCVWYWIPEVEGNDDPLRHLIAYYGPLLADEMLKYANLSQSDFHIIRQCTDDGDYERARALVTDKMFKLAITGDIDQIIAQIEHLSKIGITQLNIGPPLGANPRSALEKTGKIIEYFSDDI